MIGIFFMGIWNIFLIQKHCLFYLPKHLRTFIWYWAAKCCYFTRFEVRKWFRIQISLFFHRCSVYTLPQICNNAGIVTVHDDTTVNIAPSVDYFTLITIMPNNLINTFPLSPTIYWLYYLASIVLLLFVFLSPIVYRRPTAPSTTWWRRPSCWRTLRTSPRSTRSTRSSSQRTTRPGQPIR